MKMKTILIVLVVLLLAGLGTAEQIQPNADLLTKGADGAYVVIVSGWGDQVTVINGVARLGSVGNTIVLYPIEDGE
jgi:hypothetical protein